MSNKLAFLTKDKTLLILIGIFLLGLICRFIYFNQSIYFGIDEARDAYISQRIYTQGDLKVVGPNAGASGLFHGVLFWYLLGPIYLFFAGDPIGVSAVFRIINALGVFLIFGIGKLFFDRRVGIIAALIYAVSFEESQFAMYVGNPSLAVISWLLIFLGVGLIYRARNRFLAILLIFGGFASLVQFELMQVFCLVILVIIFAILRAQFWRVRLIYWIAGILLFGLLISSFVLYEFKSSFYQLHTGFDLITSGYQVIEVGQNKYSTYLAKLAATFNENIFYGGGVVKGGLLGIVIVAGLLIWQARQSVEVRLSLVWLFAGAAMLISSGYNAYYIYAGINGGLILGVSFLLSLVYSANKWIFSILLGMIVVSNFLLILGNNYKSLNVGIKAQTLMRLVDERQVIDRMYKFSGGNEFTVRATSMPYRAQTVWAYLLNGYAKDKYGYVPLWETGNLLGFPGELPTPKSGTSCVRFLVTEPVRGIPVELIEGDRSEENYFSEVISSERIGAFNLEYRKAKALDCHN